ncbi:MAG: hypothetical protein LBF85_11095 [Tannerella sp.]|jgi:hypothetical protein|nr:hypothetical protein [Tannerella sp.]
MITIKEIDDFVLSELNMFIKDEEPMRTYTKYVGNDTTFKLSIREEDNKFRMCFSKDVKNVFFRDGRGGSWYLIENEVFDNLDAAFDYIRNSKLINLK